MEEKILDFIMEYAQEKYEQAICLNLSPKHSGQKKTCQEKTITPSKQHSKHTRWAYDAFAHSQTKDESQTTFSFDLYAKGYKLISWRTFFPHKSIASLLLLVFLYFPA